MRNSIIATTCLLLAEGTNAAALPNMKIEFMRAMKASSNQAHRSRRLSRSHKAFDGAFRGHSGQGSSLRDKIIEKSTAAKHPNGQRHLQNYNNYNSQAQNNGSYNSNGYNGRSRNRNGNKADSDDYYAIYGDWDNAFGFDVAQYSLSYHRCAAVSQFDNELAAQDDTDRVFRTKQFAVFRFCPESTCMGLVDDEEEEDWEQEQWANWQNGGQQQRSGENNQAADEQEAAAEDQGGEYRNGAEYDCMNYNEDGECEEERLFGARGEGCQDNYGEYLVELEDYLELLLEFQEERLTQYCQYCERCMYDVYAAWLENGGQHDDRKLSYEEFKDLEEESRKLGGNVDGGQADAYFYQVCPEYDTCSEYKYTCENGMDEHLAEYFECTEVEKANGMVAYVGPHCAEDGFTVTLGVYSDQYCSEYIGNGANIAAFIGEQVDIEEDALKSFYNSANGALDLLKYSNEEDVCIPCRKADMPYEESEYVPQNDDHQEAQVNYGEFEINEICENLYMVSARCDKNYRSYNTKSKQAKYAEAVAQEDLTCDFIDSIVMGNYNEMGSVNLRDGYRGNQPEWQKNSMYAQQYGHYITEVTPLQIFGLVVSISACAILATWAMSLRQSRSKGGPWVPRRGLKSSSALPNEDAPDRQNSGILMGRSMSGILMGRSTSNASYYMT